MCVIYKPQQWGALGPSWGRWTTESSGRRYEEPKSNAAILINAFVTPFRLIIVSLQSGTHFISFFRGEWNFEVGLRVLENVPPPLVYIVYYYTEPIAMGWTVRESNHGGGEIFRTRPARSWGPPSLLYNGYRVFPGDKAAGAWC